MSYRNFSQDAETVAREWRGQVMTGEQWREEAGGGRMPSAARPFWVRTKTVRAVAKPSHSNPPVSEVAVAAHEKICADLAYDLGLPVPPVILWNRDQRPAGEEKFTAISAVPFPAPRQWSEIKSNPAHLGAVRGKMVAVVSAMTVFDTWVQNIDHNDHPGNLLICIDSAGELQVAYIDYAYSLAYPWKSQQANHPQCCSPYDPKIAADATVQHSVISGVQAIPEASIRGLVERVPEEFLSSQHRTLIIDGLLDRQKRLIDIMKTTYPGLR